MVHLIIGLKKFNSDIRNMSEDEVENRRLDYLKDLVKKIVDAKQQIDDTPDLDKD